MESYFQYNDLGFYSYRSDKILIENCTIYNNDHSGLLLNSSEDCEIKNTTISDSKKFDIQFDGKSHATIFNSSFNNSKIDYIDFFSSLTVQWYLHVYVINGTGIPVSNAEVQVKDKSENVMYFGFTDAGGFCNWILCNEYTEMRTGIIALFTPHNISVFKPAHELAQGKMTPNMNRTKSLNY